ncbi:thiol reductant ABC exporter subunit CydD [Janthinobacterium sp. 1_2014MBL_MicDiv]|uniref:thiol reductant ABC exporter subunit CydD n=1 Tax=Janthinobacterium sp. 1_2014MBL_MicDiv TaxID=1644131 RepID=UPI0008F50201|nr:thiol reductant ABC exporter subunit CydD [Janthinobacterium sp. 1_2014MBL_MicDiv]APA69018.1 ABC transporter ATP-binding protein [Janthinobacterium sp. 1_2014MBL_MicDiv]
MPITPLSLPRFILPRVASLVQGGAALLWLPQSALLAWALQAMLDGAGWRAALAPAAGVLLLGVLRAWGEAWGARRMYAAARAHLSALRAQVALALARRSPLDRQRAQSGQAASVIAEQAEAIVPYLVRYKPARWKVMLVPLVILAVVAPLSWIAALILMIAAPLIPVFMALVGMGAQAASRAQMVEMGGMNAFLLDRLRGLATLRALDAVDATAERLEASSQSVRRRTMVVLRIAFLSSAVLELFSALGVAMVAAFIGFSLLGSIHFGTWGRELSLAQGMFILLLAPAFFEPLRELAAVWHDKAAGEAGLAGLHDLAEGGMPLPGADVAVAAVSAAAMAVAAPPAVDIHQLRFAHPGEAPVFAQFDLSVRAGEHVALLGASGAGKTTLLSLLAGLLPASGGEIRIGGVRLNDSTVNTLRQRMAWMGQRPHVFAASVSQNVTLGRTDASAVATQAKVTQALHLADLAAVAQAQPAVMLSDGGQGLSGGEAVRLALARVALHPHADLLLVDEPTAHLDSETAARVTDALLLLARGKTLIVATHDPVLASRLQRTVRVDAPARSLAQKAEARA